MESGEVKQESVKAEPAMEIDFKSEVDNDDNYTFQHDLAKSCANIEANLGKSVMDEKEAIGLRDVASNLQQFKQELEENDVGQTVTRNLALAQEHVQKLRNELEIATTKIDEHKRENLEIIQENQRLKMDIERRDAEVFTMGKSFALKNNEHASEKYLNHKLSQENKEPQKTLEEQHLEVTTMSKTTATNCLELETEKSLIEKLTKENKQLKMALERPNSVRWCSSQFQASLMDIQGNKDRKEINTLKMDIQKMDQENLRLRKLLEKAYSRARQDSEIIDLNKIQGRKDRKKIDTLKADVEKLSQRIANVTQENLNLRKALAKTDSRPKQDWETIDSNNAIDCTKQKIADEHCVNQESSEENGIANRDRKIRKRNMSDGRTPSPGSKVKIFSCGLCYKKFTKETALKVHEWSAFHCSMCHKSFVDIGDLKQHETIHGVLKTSCTDEVNDGKSKSGHQEIKTKLFKICSERLGHLNHLTDNEKSWYWLHKQPCFECLKKFDDCLARHSKIQETPVVKPFHCSMCPKSFADKSALNQHLTVHGMPLSCPKCENQFANHKDLKKHKKIHASDEYACTECNKKFRQENHLKKHLKRHERKRKNGVLYENGFRVSKNLLNSLPDPVPATSNPAKKIRLN